MSLSPHFSFSLPIILLCTALLLDEKVNFLCCDVDLWLLARAPCCEHYPGIMSITLSDEYELWARELGFSVEELRATNVFALERSFLPAEVRERAWREHFREEGEAETLEGAVVWANAVQARSTAAR